MTRILLALTWLHPPRLLHAMGADKAPDGFGVQDGLWGSMVIGIYMFFFSFLTGIVAGIVAGAVGLWLLLRYGMTP